jgi:uncharacterized protein YbaP (TraB family)
MKKQSILLAMTLLLCTGIGLAQAPTTPTAPAIKQQATPALWKVKGTHGTVYLFGTIHVMKKDVVWETPKVKTALKSSDTLYLEIADMDDAAVKAMQPIIMQIGTDAEHPLSTKISKEDVALLDNIAREMGAPGESSFEPMKPWLVYLTLAVLPAVKSGYAPDSGIDKLLSAEAKAQNKTVKGFETVEQQVHYLADFPLAEQVTLLHEELVDMPKSVKQLDEIVADWTRGEVDKIAAIDNDELKLKHPDLYDKLLVKRNAEFADVLGTLLKDAASGNIFVAVGAGHLAGPDSVQKMLEKKGFTVERAE